MSNNTILIFCKKTMSKPNIRKRKLQEERTVFNEEWELQFYVVAVKENDVLTLQLYDYNCEKVQC